MADVARNTPGASGSIMFGHPPVPPPAAEDRAEDPAEDRADDGPPGWRALRMDKMTDLSFLAKQHTTSVNRQLVVSSGPCVLTQ